MTKWTKRRNIGTVGSTVWWNSHLGGPTLINDFTVMRGSKKFDVLDKSRQTRPYFPVIGSQVFLGPLPCFSYFDPDLPLRPLPSISTGCLTDSETKYLSTEVSRNYRLVGWLVHISRVLSGHFGYCTFLLNPFIVDSIFIVKITYLTYSSTL